MKNMLCPICSDKLVKHQAVFRCHKGHGVLAPARFLSDIDEQDDSFDIADTTHKNSDHQLICPHCKKTMHKVDYNGTHIIIDSCSSCHYRWLDAGEIGKIKNFKPRKLPSKDLLNLLDFDEMMAKTDKFEQKDPNPRLPLQGSWRAGAEGLAGVSNDRSAVRSAAILGQGLYGIYKGLTHSKHSRYLMVFTLVVFFILFLVVFMDMQKIFNL